MSETTNAGGAPAPLNRTGDPVRDRYLAGLAAQLDLDLAHLTQPGTTVLGRPDRSGTGAAVAYWADAHLVVWADPAVVDAIKGLVDNFETLSPQDFDAAALAAGFTFQAEADMCTLASSASNHSHELAHYQHHYQHRWLNAERVSDVAWVKTFVARCDPDEVEEAGLDEIDESFEETAVNVVVDPGDPSDRSDGSIRAYASALAWDWDPDFGDIGVLVDSRCRRQGLGQFTVSHTMTRLLTIGIHPLYRYQTSNLASARTAAALGFKPATRLRFYRKS